MRLYLSRSKKVEDRFLIDKIREGLQDKKGKHTVVKKNKGYKAFYDLLQKDKDYVARK